MRDIFLFDLDGTLTDSGAGIMNSVRHALKHFGIEEEDQRRLQRFVGPPLKESFRKYYGFSDAQGEKAVEAYREYYRDKGIWENKLYPGIQEGLEKLQKEGYILGVASSKPEIFVKQIAEAFGISPYLAIMAGATLDGSRVKKGDVIREALKRLDMPPSRVIMIGDRREDVLGARELGIPCAGAAYGYGEEGELVEAGAHWLIQESWQVGELPRICSQRQVDDE